MRMKLSSLCVVLFVSGYALAQMHQSQHHEIVRPDQVKWGPGSPALPPGAQTVVLAGDPGKAGSQYTMRVKVPNGYKVAPHWHPMDESVTVLQGALGIGMGDKFDAAKGQELAAGGFFRMPAKMHHYAWSKGETVFQVTGIGPFSITYVNPADDPRGTASKEASQPAKGKTGY
jgi:ChrR-like protein with cupin domain